MPVTLHDLEKVMSEDLEHNPIYHYTEVLGVDADVLRLIRDAGTQQFFDKLGYSPCDCEHCIQFASIIENTILNSFDVGFRLAKRRYGPKASRP